MIASHIASSYDISSLRYIEHLARNRATATHAGINWGAALKKSQEKRRRDAPSPSRGYEIFQPHTVKISWRPQRPPGIFIGQAAGRMPSRPTARHAVQSPQERGPLLPPKSAARRAARADIEFAIAKLRVA